MLSILTLFCSVLQELMKTPVRLGYFKNLLIILAT